MLNKSISLENDKEYQITFKTWGKIADLYQDTFMDLNIYDPSYDSFCSALTQKAPSILEVGCGPGNVSKYIINKLKNPNWTGIDISPQMIELARLNNPSAKFMVMDGRSINAFTNPFDAVICGFFVPYLTKVDLAEFIASCAGTIKPNGILYLSFVEGEDHESGLQKGSTGDEMYFYYHQLNYIEQELSHHGFSSIQVTHVDYNETQVHTLVIATKD